MQEHSDLTAPPAQAKSDASHEVTNDEIVTASWIRECLAATAREAADALIDDDDAESAWYLRWGAALHAAWIAMSQDGRARAGDLRDVADLAAAGRGGIDELVEVVWRGDYRDAERSPDGSLDLDALSQGFKAAERAALAADVISIASAADILECALRRTARHLARTPLGHEIERFDVAINHTREALIGAVAFRSLSRDGWQSVKARDLRDTIAIHRARGGGSISNIAAAVLAGGWRGHAREADGELLIDGVSRINERRQAVDSSHEQWLEGSRKPRPSGH